MSDQPEQPDPANVPKPQPDPEPVPVQAEHPHEYEVKDGDTLSAIAQAMYDDGTEPSWRRIFEANRHTIGDDPDKIKPKQMLVIPPRLPKNPPPPQLGPDPQPKP